jgi:hypothetical protein
MLGTQPPDQPVRAGWVWRGGLAEIAPGQLNRQATVGIINQFDGAANVRGAVRIVRREHGHRGARVAEQIPRFAALIVGRKDKYVAIPGETQITEVCGVPSGFSVASTANARPSRRPFSWSSRTIQRSFLHEDAAARPG